MVAALPANALRGRRKTLLLRCFVRGFCFYDGKALLPQMRRGDSLQLIREPQNKFDSNAIALHYANRKIGFIPRESNDVISKLMDSRLLRIEGEIVRVQPKADSWEQVQVAVYLIADASGT